MRLRSTNCHAAKGGVKLTPFHATPAENQNKRPFAFLAAYNGGIVNFATSSAIALVRREECDLFMFSPWLRFKVINSHSLHNRDSCQR